MSFVIFGNLLNTIYSNNPLDKTLNIVYNGLVHRSPA